MENKKAIELFLNEKKLNIDYNIGVIVFNALSEVEKQEYFQKVIFNENQEKIRNIEKLINEKLEELNELRTQKRILMGLSPNIPKVSKPTKPAKDLKNLFLDESHKNKVINYLKSKKISEQKNYSKIPLSVFLEKYRLVEASNTLSSDGLFKSYRLINIETKENTSLSRFYISDNDVLIEF